MATNGITSGKIPAPKGKRPFAAGPHFEGDMLLEHANGQRGKLASVQAEPIADLSTADETRLLAKAGIRVRKGSNL